jgi:hypothetical protein
MKFKNVIIRLRLGEEVKLVMGMEGSAWLIIQYLRFNALPTQLFYYKMVTN